MNSINEFVTPKKKLTSNVRRGARIPQRNTSWHTNIAERRKYVAFYSKRGLSLSEIVDALFKNNTIDENVRMNPDTGESWNKDTIHRDLRWIHAEWRKESIDLINDAKSVQLAEVQELYKQAWMIFQDIKIPKNLGAVKGTQASLSFATAIELKQKAFDRILKTHHEKNLILGVTADQNDRVTKKDLDEFCASVLLRTSKTLPPEIAEKVIEIMEMARAGTNGALKAPMEEAKFEDIPVDQKG